MTNRFSAMMTDPGPDKGYSWVICVCCFMINHFLGGPRNCQGNIYVILQRNTGLSREVASWANTCLALTVSISALFSGVLNYYFNWRKVLNGLALFGTLGFLLAYFGSGNIVTVCLAEVIIGLSIGPVFPTLIRITASYFVKQRGLAQNISFSGNAISSITFPLILDHVETIYGLRGTWLVLCALYIQSFIFIALTFPRDQEHYSVLNSNGSSLLVTSESLTPEITKNTENWLASNGNFVKEMQEVDGEKCEVIIRKNGIREKTTDKAVSTDLNPAVNSSALGSASKDSPPPLTFRNYIKELRQLLLDPVFVVFLFMVSTDLTLFISSFFIVIDHGIDLGMTSTSATMLLIVLSVGDFCTRLIAGRIIDKQWTSLLRFFSFTSLLSGLVYVFIGYASTPTWLYLGCFLNGTICCFTSALRMLMSTNIFDARNGATITGVIMFLVGLFSLLLPTLIGICREHLGSYAYLYLLFGVLNFSLVPVALLLDRFVQKKPNLP